MKSFLLIAALAVLASCSKPVNPPAAVPDEDGSEISLPSDISELAVDVTLAGDVTAD